MPEALKEFDELPMQVRLAQVEVIAKKKRAKADDEDPDDDNDDDTSASGDTDDDESLRGSGKEAGQQGGDEDDESAGDGMEEAPRSYAVSLSSELPVERWYGMEVLSHDPKSVNMERAKNGLNLLFNHNADMPIGRLENIRAEDGKLNADLRFYPTDDGKRVQAMVDAGMREVSIGYSIDEYSLERGKGDAPDTYTATRWTPMEGSIVSVPADPTVGVGRNKFAVHVRNLPQRAKPEEVSMTTETAAPTGANHAAEIVRMAHQHGMAERAAEWIEKGLTPDQVGRQILESRSTAPIRQPAAEQGVDLDNGERKQYSYARAILAAAEAAEGRRPQRSLELEVSEELEKRMPNSYKRLGGIFIPTSLRGSGMQDSMGASGPAIPEEVRAKLAMALRAGGSGTIDSQTANYIKEVVFTEYGGELINILRNIAMVVRMGARVLTGLSSPVGFPRQTQDVTAYWVAENNGADVTGSNVKTDLVTLVPKTLMAATAYSRQLLVQSSIDVEAMVRESIAAAHALAWDLAAIHGSGSSNQPTGIYNQSGVATHPMTTNPTYADLLAMEDAVAEANAYLGALGWLTRPNVASKAKGTLEFNVNGSRKIWEGTILEGEMDGYVARATNQISKTMSGTAATGGTESGMIFGNWNDLLIGQFGGAMEMIVDPYTLKKQGLIELSSFQMADIAVRHPKSFCVTTGMVIS